MDNLEAVEPTVEDTVVEPTVEASQEEVVQPDAIDYEAQAKVQGWRPESEYKGKEGGFVDAEQFVKNAEESLPITNAQLKVVTDKLIKRDKDFEQLSSMYKNSQQRNDDFEKRFNEREERFNERDSADIESRMHQATLNGDAEAMTSLIAEMKDIQKNAYQPPVQQQEAKQSDPVIDAWKVDNAWFDKDPELEAEAIYQFDVISKKYPGMSETEVLNNVTTEVKRRNPAKFGVPTRTPPHVEGARQVPTKSAFGFGQLSAQHQAMGKRYIADGLFKDQADFTNKFLTDNNLKIDGSDYNG